MNAKPNFFHTKRYAIALIGLLLSASAFADEGYRTFSDMSGHRFKGRLMSYDAASKEVRIERSDGKRATTPLAVFSDADRLFIIDWGASNSFLERLALRPEINSTAVSKKEIGDFDVTKKVFDAFYEIHFLNGADARLGKIDLEYCIFYNQGKRTNNIVHYDEGVCYGKGVVGSLNPSTEQVIKTKSIRLYTEGGRVGLFGSEVVSIANVRGIWLRLKTTLPSGSEIVREYRTSDDENWKWAPYSFGAGLNEGESTQTYYYLK